MTDAILVINAGSSSIKFAGYTDAGAAEPDLIGKGQVEGLRTTARFECANAAGERVAEYHWSGPLSHAVVLDYIIQWVEKNAPHVKVTAAGHRVVFGGTTYTAPTPLSDTAIAEFERLLYTESGLLGVSGISNDMRDLIASDDSRAKEAIELFVYHIAKQIGALSAVLEGLDALVFTAGIGEKSPEIRKRVCERAAWLGVRLDEEANACGRAQISTGDSAVSVWVIPTDEERMIAIHTLRTLANHG